MKLQSVQGDITKMAVDAIVNAANPTLLDGSGVNGAIHRAAGRGLDDECRTLHGCGVGDAKITGGYNLPAKYVIHAVGPEWYGGVLGEEEKLVKCYRKCMQIAIEKGIKSIAFPLISTGAFGYPKRDAVSIAIRTLREFASTDIEIYIVAYSLDDLDLVSELLG